MGGVNSDGLLETAITKPRMMGMCVCVCVCGGGGDSDS